MDAVVVGGGIVGLASAYYLAVGGADVAVYEKGSIGNGSTERSAGGIRTQFSTPVHVSLSLESIAVWEDFEETFGIDIAYRRPGYLFCARTAETARAFEDSVAIQHDQGVPSELLDPAEAREYCPGLRAEKFRAATYCPIDGFADPHLALQGFATTARAAGAEIRTNAPVTDLLCEDDRVRGVEVNGERIGSDVVVNAAGPWARRVGEMAGLSLPIAPRRRRLLVAEPESPMPEDIPLTVDLDTGSYFRPEREGAALVGGHFATTDCDADPDRFSKGIDLDWSAEALERAADYAAYFGPEAGVKRGWAGLYAVTPDHHPVIEETIPGLITAAGFSGHGFQHAPATGQLVAELALDGETTLLDIAPLESDRFDRSGTLVDERNVA
ncbi:FAD-dependent oxidoreductase [Halobacteriales archaeon QS_3_64_16]|nr:MAG: FAD-dependent oxidoreductase [Halobacteriales archaeon QS_3_64_16]